MIFGFIRVKTMANFRKGTCKTQRILDALVVKLLPILKHVLNVNSQKSFTGLWMYLKVTHGLRFHLFIFFFLGAGLLLFFHGHSCPWIMIICIQPQTWGASWCGCRNGASLFFLEQLQLCSRFKLVIRNHCIDFKVTSVWVVHFPVCLIARITLISW